MKEAADLKETVKRVLPLLQGINETQASTRPAPGKWSPKEIIGHLIDSAGNNQQKFIRCMKEDGLQFPNYEQDLWVSAQHYNDEPWEQLLLLWEQFNYHIAHIMKHILEYARAHKIVIGDSGAITLDFIIKDYNEHLRHHLKSLFPDADFLSNSFKMVC